MNKLVLSALAVSIAGTPGLASEDDWLSLDQEIESLRSSLTSQSNGPVISGYVFTTYRNSDDVEGFINQDGDDNELGGFLLDQARLRVGGSVDGYDYLISYDLAGGSADLRDAYVRWNVGDTVSVTAGEFKTPFLRSGLLESNNLFFNSDRTALGDAFQNRNTGVMLSGTFDLVGWHVAAQNDIGHLGGGGDGPGDDLLLVGRVTVDLIGEGVGNVEGAQGADDETALEVGAAIADEGGHKDGMMFGVDATLTHGPFSGHAELVDFDDGSGPSGGEMFAFLWDPSPGLSNAAPNLGPREVSDSTPWSVTGTYMITPDEYEVGVRWEDSDNSDDETILTVGVNRYIKGHDIKWSLSWSTLDTDAVDGAGSDLDTDIVSLGVGVSF